MSNETTRVLLIEDNPGDADLVRLRLTEGNSPVDVSCAERLSEGLAAIGKEPPSVVLLDLNLPDSRGADTFRTVLQKAPQIPVVILSGQDDEALAIKAVHHGVQDYLVKNEMSSSHLERAMRYAIERQALVRSLELSRKQQLDFKNRFLSHVSHELRTPITCIHQFVTILLDGLAGPVTGEQRSHLETMLKSVNQLGSMVRDLLEATRAESGKVRLEPRCVDLRELIRQASGMMKAVAQKKRVGLEVGVDSRLPFVLGDPARILEILINLIDNGIKFTPPDGAVMVEACLSEADPDFAYVSVVDSGRGIAPEAKALIFERLYQDPDAVDDNRKGLGLGLYIARELVALHGGRIWVVSDPGHGSTFTFTLPLYSLAKLLFPVIVHQGSLREAIVLVSVELHRPPGAGEWKSTCQKCVETLQRSVYIDKDLVLPPLATTSTWERIFVVASTDMERVPIMMTRVREQLEKCADLKLRGGEVKVSARPVPLPGADGQAVEVLVREVAGEVTDLMMRELGLKSALPAEGQCQENEKR